MSDTTTWLTPQAHRKLQDELRHLETEGRRYIEDRIAEARSHGDLRENAEYDAAKNEQGMMEARIRKIRHLLEKAEVREAGDSPHAGVGSVVKVTDDGGDEMEFFIASQENRVPGYLLASPDGPLGQALMGAAPGDTVTYEAPGGTFSYTVTEVRPFDG
jgi:transcription elongation factor GreA